MSGVFQGKNILFNNTAAKPYSLWERATENKQSKCLEDQPATHLLFGKQVSIPADLEMIKTSSYLNNWK